MSHAAGAQVFAKCGILKEDDDGRPRVKIYRDKATGMSKGDGLVSYLKEPSVRVSPQQGQNAGAAALAPAHAQGVRVIQQ